MPKGIAWIGSSHSDSGKILVQQDDGSKELVPALLYVVNGTIPPLYELAKWTTPKAQMEMAEGTAENSPTN